MTHDEKSETKDSCYAVHNNLQKLNSHPLLYGIVKMVYLYI